MPTRKPTTKRGKRKVMGDEMRKFYAGKLHSGSERGPIVEDPAQAKAIGMKVSGQSRYGKRKAKRSRRRMSR